MERDNGSRRSIQLEGFAGERLDAPLARAILGLRWLSRDGVLDTIFRGADLDPITDSKELITYLEQVAPWH